MKRKIKIRTPEQQLAVDMFEVLIKPIIGSLACDLADRMQHAYNILTEEDRLNAHRREVHKQRLKKELLKLEEEN